MAGSGSSERAKLAAGLIAAGHTAAATAEKVGAGERSVRRWMKQPKFRARVREHRRAALGQTTGLLATAAPKAVATVVGLLKSENEKVRLGAVREILASLRALVADQDLADQLADLEGRLGEDGTPGGQ